MRPIRIVMLAGHTAEASIHCDGACDEDGAFYATVTIAGQLEEKRIYGADPLQAFVLGCTLIENLTQDRRMSAADAQTPETVWQISSG
ncbi:hypothetical protein [Paracoccus shanxieyensis]|uniref:Uncharacterized protein n=1 Tax=Paracoccus shanxieyensis TaxID=2675752 RepID=A0A6L6J539_9RHOB|nr:hypothetical protein [Paracoccus shanxieyensis]MTH65887.1 hypothetical protein [Paracoccus shanxieyensis]MTH89204.1 hypothetical protein [Paracoccus shanxieyensis]